MSRTFGATAQFPNSAAARAAVARLLRAGFHRSDIDTWPRDGAYLVHVRSGEDDRAAALKALGQDNGPAIGGIVANRTDRFLYLGLAALAGYALYATARRD